MTNDFTFDSQMALNKLVSVSRYLLWMNRNPAAESLVGDLIMDQIFATPNGAFIELAHAHAEKWQAISALRPDLIWPQL
jgi:hypothetical protein